jgi:hypothetical protein
MMPVKLRSDAVTGAAVTNLTIGGSCLASFTAEASCAGMASVANAAAPDAAAKTLANTTRFLFFMRVASYQK